MSGFSEWLKESDLREMANWNQAGEWKMLGNRIHSDESVKSALSKNPGGLDLEGLVRAMDGGDVYDQMNPGEKDVALKGLRAQISRWASQGLVNSKKDTRGRVTYILGPGRSLADELASQGMDDRDPGSRTKDLIHKLKSYWIKQHQGGEAARATDFDDVVVQQFNRWNPTYWDLYRYLNGPAGFVWKILDLVASRMRDKFAPGKIANIMAHSLVLDTPDGLPFLEKLLNEHPDLAGPLVSSLKETEVFHAVFPKIFQQLLQMVKTAGPRGPIVLLKILKGFPPELSAYADLLRNQLPEAPQS